MQCLRSAKSSANGKKARPQLFIARYDGLYSRGVSHVRGVCGGGGGLVLLHFASFPLCGIFHSSFLGLVL